MEKKRSSVFHRAVMSKILPDVAGSAPAATADDATTGSPTGDVKRRLFESDSDSDLDESVTDRVKRRQRENIEFAERELRLLNEESKRTWDFDFATGLPVSNGTRYEWFSSNPVAQSSTSGEPLYVLPCVPRVGIRPVRGHSGHSGAGRQFS